MRRLIALEVVAVVTVVLSGADHRAAAAEQQAEPAPGPVHVFAQVGTGLAEVGHVEVGGFLGPHLTIEAMAAWDGVFGGHYGGGLMAAIGHAQGWRTPRHALLIGARLMLNDTATFDSHGDNLASHGVLPIGYAFLADGGFYFRATLGPVVYTERVNTTASMPLAPPVYDHKLVISGPFFNVAAGLAF